MRPIGSTGPTIWINSWNPMRKPMKEPLTEGPTSTSARTTRLSMTTSFVTSISRKLITTALKDKTLATKEAIPVF